MRELSEIQEECFRINTSHGFTDTYNLMDREDYAAIISWEERNTISRMLSIAEIGLINTEVAEVIDEVRSSVPNNAKIAEELADIIIRTLNIMSRWGFDATEEVNKKMEINRSRKYLHGKRC